MSITTLPVPPQRRDPANFPGRADAFFDALYNLSLELNVEVANVAAAAASVASSAGATLWSAGTYAIGTKKFSAVNGMLYRRTVGTASAVDPGTDSTGWVLETLPDWQLVKVAGTSQTGYANAEFLFQNSASCELILPASPANDVALRGSMFNGRGDNWLRCNGQLLMGKAEDMRINIPYWSRRIKFVGGTLGWGVFR